MAYGDFTKESLDTAVFDLFGLHVDQFPERVVIYPFGLENFIGNKWKEMNSHFSITPINIPDRYFSQYKNFLIENSDKVFFLCMGGRGASDFTDSSLLLCQIENVEEILFIGNGAGIGKDIRSKDIHIPRVCNRYEQITEFFVEDSFTADGSYTLIEKIKRIVEKQIEDEDIRIHSENHATVPFFYSETTAFLEELSEESITIDMEMSVLYTLAKIHNKKCCGLLRIGDLPLQGEDVWVTTDLRRPHLGPVIKDIFMRSLFDFGLKR